MGDMNTMGAAAAMATFEWMAARILQFYLLPFARICTFDAIDTIGEYNAPIILPPNLEWIARTVNGSARLQF